MRIVIRQRLPRNRITALALSLVTVFWFSAWAFEIPAPITPATDPLLEHVRYLASDELMGRGVDTAGIKLARDYIARKFAQYGLLPGGDNGTYFQTFEAMTGVIVKQPTALMLDGVSTLALEEDWTPLGLSASGHSEASVVFVGYGITAKDYGYDDYAEVDAKGKIVIALRYEPPPKDDKSPFRKAPRYSTYATLRAKANNARDHGAVGLVLVDQPLRQGARELISTRSSFARIDNGILAAQVKRQIIEKWLGAQRVSLSELKEKIDRYEKPASMTLPGLKVSLTVTLEPVRQQTENVVGILSGSDPNLKDENIIIGAHYDHLGLGYFGTLDSSAEGQIHHGADDNASGTSVLLGVAEQLARVIPKPGRTVIFAAFSGEELGLLGSRRYVDHPAMPLASTKAMLNMDMVGRLRENRLTIFGTRSGKELSDIVQEQARRLGLEVTESDGVGRSDHMSFYNRKIPALHFFTGSHPDYHRPSDTWDKVNVEGMNKVRDLVLAIAQQLTNTKNPLNFVSLPSRPPTEERATSQGYGAYLGTIPDFADTVEGVRLAGVTDGSPAAVAGLKEGDVIVQFAGSKVRSLEDLAMLLGTKQPGDQVEIVVLRMSQPLTLTAVLRNRG
jgi:Peptidase family M28/PDZ domain